MPLINETDLWSLAKRALAPADRPDERTLRAGRRPRTPPGPPRPPGSLGACRSTMC